MRSRYATIDANSFMKPLLQKTLLAALVAILIYLVFSDKSPYGFGHTIRVTLMSGVVPVLDLLSKPVEAVDRLAQRGDDLLDVYSENEQLKLENQRLLEWQAVALKLEAENKGLRDLVNYQPKHAQTFVTAKVVGYTANTVSQRLLINAGSDQGIQPQQAVITNEGVVGRIMTVGSGTAEILLLTDMNSRIPVITEPSGVRSILAGNRSDMPHLTFLGARKQPELGDVVVTSADGDLFPAGLPIGKLFAEKNGEWQVRPFTDLSSVRYVQVVTLEHELPKAVEQSGTSDE